ncbi:hypothetical protein [Streptomyces sp. NPDC058667]|uniref:hypothetical protein n=1 Tax=Streptomyces sp. NPDC058667 TaxID=3346588 RepID=UPI00364FE2CA
MPLKAHYQATRADTAALAQHAQPGDRLYVIGGEFIVTDDTSAIGGSHMVRPADSTTTHGSITIPQLLARCGAVFTQPPTQ